MSLERQKDLYDRIIIPAACETIPGPALQEMPQRYEIAYAKSRSFQEKPGNKRWRAEDESRSLHLQYAIPTQYLMPFWRSILKHADSFQILNRSGEPVPYFKNPRLLFQSHDLKNTFGRETLQETLSLFQETVLQALDPVHLDIRSCWLDIGFRDHAACPGPQASSGSEPFTLLWKSRCHHHLHEKLSQVNHSTLFEADYFQGFLLRDIADYQSKATSSGASNPGRREQGDPGIIRFKAYNCIKEQVSVMFNSYNIFGSGFLPLLALNEDMMKSLSSTSEGGQGAPVTQTSRSSLLKAWRANKRHVRAISDTKSRASYGIRKEMTFRLDTILTMWDRGYFDPGLNPHVGRLSWNVSLTSSTTEHYLFWIVTTRDINCLVFAQAARYIVPLDHLFLQASRRPVQSSPQFILALYTAQLFCRLLMHCLNAERRFLYDNWIWQSRWTVKNGQKRRSLLERRGLGLDDSVTASGMPWIPQHCMDWSGGHIALETLVQIYLPRNPVHACFIHQPNVQLFTANEVSVEHCLQQWVQEARLKFDRGHRQTAEELVDSITHLAVEEVARAYHLHMLSKMQQYWSRVLPQKNLDALPHVRRLRQSQEQSVAQVGRIVTAQTIWEINDEAWGIYNGVHLGSASEQTPEEIPCWKAARKLLPPEDGWSEFVFRRLFSRPDRPTWNGLAFLKLYRRFMEIWEVIQEYAGPFDARFRRLIGHFILVTFNSDRTKEIGTNCSSGTWYEDQPSFFRIQFWAPYFSPPKSNMGCSWASIDDYQCRNPLVSPGTLSLTLNDEEFQCRADHLRQLWSQFVLQKDSLQQMKPMTRSRRCGDALQCLMDLTGPRWPQSGDDMAYALPWKFYPSKTGLEFEDPFRVPISSTSVRFASRPCRPMIVLPSRQNVIVLTDAIQSLLQLSRRTIQRIQRVQALLVTSIEQYDIRSHLEAKRRAIEAVTRLNPLLKQFLTQTEPPQREIRN
ncbi:hypothetical protein NCS57_01476700 [Fusarium keratoplasticum]|uniref:Uncharacterized protein n=1 Tax=Fusarium keratoplasticum TaxID=1328300 RepID=A0ACC0QAP0_9HYPO|nr:hypothetical protein NCS57_01476700 [Fusarium keratoplasticum]KAI8648650.1 hypothetical protein NCS57_01476700 [Fusarium keratoplasticum]